MEFRRGSLFRKGVKFFRNFKGGLQFDFIFHSQLWTRTAVFFDLGGGRFFVTFGLIGPSPAPSNSCPKYAGVLPFHTSLTSLIAWCDSTNNFKCCLVCLFTFIGTGEAVQSLLCVHNSVRSPFGRTMKAELQSLTSRRTFWSGWKRSILKTTLALAEDECHWALGGGKR